MRLPLYNKVSLFFYCLFPTFLSAQWTDHFEDICGINQWMDIQETEGWDIQALESFNISLTYPGYCVLMPHTVSWYADWRGPLIYRMVEGDFVLTANITVSNRAADDIPASDYSLGGLMVRNPKTLTNGPAGWVPGQEDYVFLSLGMASTGHPTCPGCPAPHFEVKSTINSNSTLMVSSIDTNVVDIRMVRLNPYVFVLYRFPGEIWEVHHRYFRDDLEDSVQIGMVTYTDWNKVFTYTPLFHNSHVLNEDLDPDPSNNPGLPFAPDIITSYDYLDFKPSTMPDEWIGLNLLDVNQLSDEEILAYFGDTILTPLTTTAQVWLGRENQDWMDPENWLSGSIPSSTDTVRINSCLCPEADCVIMPLSTIIVSGLWLSEGAVMTIPAGATLEVNGPLVNDGTLIIYGELVITNANNHEVINRGEIDCRETGVLNVFD